MRLRVERDAPHLTLWINGKQVWDVQEPINDKIAGETSAEQLGINYREILRRRLLHLMNPDESAELAAGGVDFQLHTHYHRMPQHPELLWEEIKQNRRRISEWTGGAPGSFLLSERDLAPESTAVAKTMRHTERYDVSARLSDAHDARPAAAARGRSFATGPG